MNLLKVMSVIIVFTVGIIAGLYLATASAGATQQNTWEDGTTGDSVQFADQIAALNPFQPSVVARESPKDRVKENAIAVYRDRVILDIKDVQWATFTDTHSMEPVITAGANALEIVPVSEDDVKVGDIVSYKSEYADGNIIHRVVFKGKDEKGTYFVMKGDNLPTSDPGKIRFSQMQRVVVAIIY